jgi:hypothetical protein
MFQTLAQMAAIPSPTGDGQSGVAAAATATATAGASAPSPSALSSPLRQERAALKMSKEMFKVKDLYFEASVASAEGC